MADLQHPPVRSIVAGIYINSAVSTRRSGGGGRGFDYGVRHGVLKRNTAMGLKSTRPIWILWSRGRGVAVFRRRGQEIVNGPLQNTVSRCTSHQ